MFNSESSLMHYKVRPSNDLFQPFFSHCNVDHKKTVAISQMFNHVQLYAHWMHLLNTRICRHTYITHTIIHLDKDRCAMKLLNLGMDSTVSKSDAFLTTFGHKLLLLYLLSLIMYESAGKNNCQDALLYASSYLQTHLYFL